MGIHEAVSEFTDPPKPKGKLRAVARKRQPLPEAVHDAPLDELRRLVKQHANLTRTSVSLHHMRTDRVSLKDGFGRAKGDIIPCLLTDAARADLERAQERIDGDDARLQGEMARALRKVPIWKWLGGVYGIAERTGAVLVGETRIDIATKPSKLKRFFGVAVSSATGRLERPTAGQKNAWHAGIRCAIFQAFTAMRKNGAKVTADAPFGKTSKYLDIWHNAVFGALHDPRFDAEKNTWSGRPAGRKAIGQRGMWKAADVFVEDLYTVWRAMEGLEVWPDWYDVRRGHLHGGEPIGWTGPRVITLEEALRIVGDVGGRPLMQTRTWKTTPDEEESANEDEK